MDWIAELNRLWTQPALAEHRHQIKTMSDEWKLARRGRLTASSRARSIAGPRAVGNFPKLRDKILAELRPDYKWTEQSFAATDWGNDHERQALSLLELELGLDADQSYEPGFLLHPERPYVGCTPDLMIRNRHRAQRRGLHYTAVQVKCPHDEDIHKSTLHKKKIGADVYRYQIQWEGWCTNADELLFVSFDPRQRRLDRRLVILDVPVDDKLRKIFESRCDQFLDFMEGRVATSRPVGIDSLASYF